MLFDLCLVFISSLCVVAPRRCSTNALMDLAVLGADFTQESQKAESENRSALRKLRLKRMRAGEKAVKERKRRRHLSGKRCDGVETLTDAPGGGQENSVHPEANQQERLPHSLAPHLHFNRHDGTVTSSKAQLKTRLRHHGKRSYSRNNSHQQTPGTEVRRSPRR